MNLSPLPLGWRTLALAVLLGACRVRTPPAPAVDWKPGAGARAEAAALLLLDKDGMAKVVCLPGPTQEHQLFPGVAWGRILDVSWKGGATVAGWLAAPDDAEPSRGEELVLQVAHGGPHRLAKGVRTARFSPDGSALAYEVSQPGNSGVGMAPPSTYVLELATGKVVELGAFADPLWEADGKHLRATRLRLASEERRASTMHRTSLRARWERESGTATVDGPGSAQIPAPLGEAVAWSEEPRSAVARKQCAIFLSRWGGVRHSIVGSFCMGTADDRAVRWSPDGRWLAFPHPGHVAGQGKPEGSFVDVVGVEGGRYPALSALRARARPEQLAIATTPGEVWFDWSPSGRFLALHDGLSDLRVYDFETQGMDFLGKGQRPMWSPGGSYLLVLTVGQVAAIDRITPSHRSQNAQDSGLEAFVLPGIAPAGRIDLGPVRDARWLPAQACEKR